MNVKVDAAGEIKASFQRSDDESVEFDFRGITRLPGAAAPLPTLSSNPTMLCVLPYPSL